MLRFRRETDLQSIRTEDFLFPMMIFKNYTTVLKHGINTNQSQGISK